MNEVEAPAPARPKTLPPVLIAPHAALKKAAPLTDITDEVDEVIARLLELLTGRVGPISLSAPQIGRPFRVFVVSAELADTNEPLVFVNPIILSAGPTRRRAAETCLSVRGAVRVNRATRVKVSARDRRGELFTVDAGDALHDIRGISRIGLYARAVQHEIDHLNGVLTTDRR